ncbi:MAG: hypothetical protein M3495_12080 [Pseudomonadota bacterium]|nr:hypothetical protein [Pseudomonadota bacterium]
MLEHARDPFRVNDRADEVDCRAVGGARVETSRHPTEVVMGSLNERNPSLWVKTSPEARYRALSGKPSFDASVIGGGTASRICA